jgi:HAMP domain-containing protein
MGATPGPSREVPASVATRRQPSGGLPPRDAAAASPARAWLPWAAGATGLLLIAALVVLAIQLGSAAQRVAALESRATALAGEVEALRAAETAAASRLAETRAVVEELRRQVDVLSARAPAPALPPPPAAPRTPPPSATPRTAPGR